MAGIIESVLKPIVLALIILIILHIAFWSARIIADTVAWVRGRRGKK